MQVSPSLLSADFANLQRDVEMLNASVADMQRFQSRGDVRHPISFRLFRNAAGNRFSGRSRLVDVFLRSYLKKADNARRSILRNFP